MHGRINAHNVFAYGLLYGGINRSGMGGGVKRPATFYDYLRDQTIARPLQGCYALPSKSTKPCPLLDQL